MNNANKASFENLISIVFRYELSKLTCIDDFYFRAVKFPFPLDP